MLRSCCWPSFWILWTFLSCVQHVLANTEKTIFLAPPSVLIEPFQPNLDALNLLTLSGDLPSVRLSLQRALVSDSNPRGLQSWYFLSNLNPGQRYELRVCWAANEPTEFWIDTFTLRQVFDTPDLIGALAVYTEARATAAQQLADPLTITRFQGNNSILFLRIQAAADYYSSNETLMKYPPPVTADIILDPYILSIFPQSLLPTGAYIILLAISSWFISRYVYNFILSLAHDTVKPHTD